MHVAIGEGGAYPVSVDHEGLVPRLGVRDNVVPCLRVVPLKGTRVPFKGVHRIGAQLGITLREA